MKANWTATGKRVDGVFPSAKTGQSSTRASGKMIYGPHTVSQRHFANCDTSGIYSYTTGEQWLGERKDGLEHGKITIYWYVLCFLSLIDLVLMGIYLTSYMTRVGHPLRRLASSNQSKHGLAMASRWAGNCKTDVYVYQITKTNN